MIDPESSQWEAASRTTPPIAALGRLGGRLRERGHDGADGHVLQPCLYPSASVFTFCMILHVGENVTVAPLCRACLPRKDPLGHLFCFVFPVTFSETTTTAFSIADVE